MIYLSSFKLSDHQVKNPNIYPYNVFAGKDIEPFVFAPITIFYGNNGSGKSTLLNIIANSLELKGREYATSNSYGIVDYCGTFSSECSYSLGEDELDEPEVSLSPANQVALAEEINKMARFLQCQFIVATHSPFMLGTLNAKIYNLDRKEYEITKWTDLENVRYFYDFFKEHKEEFE